MVNESPILLLLKVGMYVKPGIERCFYQLLFLEFHKFTNKIPIRKFYFDNVGCLWFHQNSISSNIFSWGIYKIQKYLQFS